MRRLGQHFLFDPAILDRIVAALDPKPDDVVVEIGPGKGTLTERLLRRVGHVIAIEKDRELAAALSSSVSRLTSPDRMAQVARSKERGAGGDAVQGAGSREQGAGGGGGRLTVVEGDALKLDWHSLLPSPVARLPSFKVAGNIPYYITSPLIEKALTPPPPAVIVYLVQREVADRLAAAPGSKQYGALTVGVAADATVERLFTVRAGSFRPPPKVESAVVRIVPRTKPLIEAGERGGFRAFATAVFSRRRKQMVNALGAVPGLEPGPIRAALEAVGVPPTSRPEVFSPEVFVALYRALMR